MESFFWTKFYQRAIERRVYFLTKKSLVLLLFSYIGMHLFKSILAASFIAPQVLFNSPPLHVRSYSLNIIIIASISFYHYITQFLLCFVIYSIKVIAMLSFRTAVVIWFSTGHRSPATHTSKVTNMTAITWCRCPMLAAAYTFTPKRTPSIA